MSENILEEIFPGISGKDNIQNAIPPEVYMYDENTGEYLRTGIVPLDPRASEREGKAVWLVPAFSTFTEPPAKLEGHVLVWNGEEWTNVEDNRGKIYWLGDSQEPIIMQSLGAFPEGALLECPPVILTEAQKFETLRAIRNQKLAEYDNAIAQLNRKYRCTISDGTRESVNRDMLIWDTYANALCNLPEKEGAPWDGGGPETPWPPVPFSCNTDNSETNSN